ncbi:hypothetical protein BDP27DRAFT_1420880 [Rhodocollybia butyracea]|uniref:Uncharacterized protein n=1 Tax=Rhodocollybia butyracea TaxID=206335 RepID=A0A9P5PWY1_9AGAR|nr:hypothetical protein BDP27DRAFT_1420880 [Rhodocollybia butyracea]
MKPPEIHHIPGASEKIQAISRILLRKQEVPGLSKPHKRYPAAGDIANAISMCLNSGNPDYEVVNAVAFYTNEDKKSKTIYIARNIGTQDIMATSTASDEVIETFAEQGKCSLDQLASQPPNFFMHTKDVFNLITFLQTSSESRNQLNLEMFRRFISMEYAIDTSPFQLITNSLLLDGFEWKSNIVADMVHLTLRQFQIISGFSPSVLGSLPETCTNLKDFEDLELEITLSSAY